MPCRYTHILAYLRSSDNSTLPVAVRYGSGFGELQTVMELRDEGHFLAMVDLYDLCNEWIRRHESRTLQAGRGVRESPTAYGSSQSLSEMPAPMYQQQRTDHQGTNKGVHAEKEEMGELQLQVLASLRGRSPRRLAPHPKPPADWI